MNDSVEYKKYINLSEAEKAMSIINVFYEERCNGLEDLSKTLYDILVDSKNTVEQYVASAKISDKKVELSVELLSKGAQSVLENQTSHNLDLQIYYSYVLTQRQYFCIMLFVLIWIC